MTGFNNSVHICDCILYANCKIFIVGTEKCQVSSVCKDIPHVDHYWCVIPSSLEAWRQCIAYFLVLAPRDTQGPSEGAIFMLPVLKLPSWAFFSCSSDLQKSTILVLSCSFLEAPVLLQLWSALFSTCNVLFLAADECQGLYQLTEHKAQPHLTMKWVNISFLLLTL